MPEMHFYLPPAALDSLAKGGKSMFSRISDAVTAVGWRVHLCDEAQRHDIPHRDGWHLVNNREPPSDRCLTLRVAGFQPFWQIERTNDRQDWEITHSAYEPPDVPPERIAQFLAQWRKVVLEDRKPTQGGGIFVPLQGQLTERQYFQSASPILMLHQVLTRYPQTRVTSTLHPKETYDTEEREALARLQALHPNFHLQTGGSLEVLATCDQVICENSSVAMKGFLWGKPAMFWARIDFHHIAASVPHTGEEAAFAQLEQAERPDFGRYLFWYCRLQSLFGWEDNPGRIRARLRDLGWPIP